VHSSSVEQLPFLKFILGEIEKQAEPLPMNYTIAFDAPETVILEW
jgi:hypothetical protein